MILSVPVTEAIRAFVPRMGKEELFSLPRLIPEYDMVFSPEGDESEQRLIAGELTAQAVVWVIWFRAPDTGEPHVHECFLLKADYDRLVESARKPSPALIEGIKSAWNKNEKQAANAA